jgi:hypothetical protein
VLEIACCKRTGAGKMVEVGQFVALPLIPAFPTRCCILACILENERKARCSINKNHHPIVLTQGSKLLSCTYLLRQGTGRQLPSHSVAICSNRRVLLNSRSQMLSNALGACTCAVM